MLHASSYASHGNAAVTIKQEPLGHGYDYSDVDVPAPVFHTPWAHTAFYADDVQPPFIDLVDDVAMDDDANDHAWSMRRPHAPTTALDGPVLDDTDELPSLLCKEDAPRDDALADHAPGMTSPVATSDVTRFHGPHHAFNALAKPVSPWWGEARRHATMASAVSPMSSLRPLKLRKVEPTPTSTPTRQCSIHGCKEKADNAVGADEGDRCQRHMGGRLCKTPGCTKTTQSHGLCIRHGGGRRCEVAGCPRGAQARGKCKAHGGGVRCKAPDCTRSSQGSGLCRTHGGGKLCDYPGCKKGTQRHGKCSTHGGAHRCRVDGCEKVDRGGGFCGRHKKTEAEASETEATEQAALV